MKILEKNINPGFPIEWANLDFLPDSKGEKKEIYLVDKENIRDHLMLMFYNLFGDIKYRIQIYNFSWWDFCLDTWDPNKDEYNYDLMGKSFETTTYLTILKESDIENEYDGICSCNDWDKFLTIVLNCIISHQAPYSPIFFNQENDLFFYFHHSGSIGLYYKRNNDFISGMLKKAVSFYNIK